MKQLRSTLDIVVLALALSTLACIFIDAPARPSAGMTHTESDGISILSDAGPADVARVRQALTELRTQFHETFAPILRHDLAAGTIRLVLFDSESDFRAYTQRLAPALAGSAGFYVAGDNRLSVLNQTGSAPFARARDQILSRQRSLQTAGIQAAAQLDAWDGQLLDEARAATDRLVRHEAAHQLFHAYRIESPTKIELTWLSEGLAEYCEVSPLGAFHPQLAERLVRARDAGKLLPLSELLAHRDVAGFFALPANRTETAYAQSWALVYLLMQDQNRDEFFSFVRHYQAGACPELPANLDAQWQTFINNL